MGRDHQRIVTWLWIGMIMVFVQILLGGITRLTGSGLSITRWDIVTGTIPPLNEAQWNQTFELYKETPQYQKINEGISLSDFKFIFFWEYFHRLWARSMGFVFL
ncbi:MAG TPA: COX15/CtaA family protein, partial [Saprospiraceae bacterium]|nr:COX15/CtaA family protein [Saprospiraceae bacterium]